MSSTAYAKYTGLASAGSNSVIAVYANFAAFPVSAPTGDLAVDASTGNLYEFNGVSWAQIAGPNAAMSLGNLDSEATSAAKGANLVSGVLAMQSASDTMPGLVNLSTQTFKGNKTIDGTIAASNLSGTNTGDQTITLTGDVTGSGTSSFATTIGANKVANSQLAQMPTLTIKGNNTGGTATPLDLTVAQVKTMLSLTGTNSGDVTLGTASGLSLAGQVLSLGLASSGVTGALSGTDWTTFNNKGSGTVTAVSVVSTNGFTGSSSGGATPALTLGTSITGVLKGTGTAIAAATSGTDFSAGTSGLTTGILKSTTTTGALTIAVAGDFPTLNQNTSGTAANITASSNSTLTTLSALTLPASQLSGTLAAGQFPALTGDITTSAGALATTLATVNSNVGSFTNANITVNGKGLITAAANGAAGSLTVVSKTTTYAASITDGLILCSGSAFTVTLPTAVGNSGAVLRVKKTDASLTNQITVGTTSSQTIDGITTFLLSTQYEEVTVVSDGANWQILSHTYPSTWVAYTPVTAGLGTLSSAEFYSRRVGDSLQVRGRFTSGTATGAQMSIALGYGGTSGNCTSATTYTNTGLVGYGTYGVNVNSVPTVLIGASQGALLFGFQATGSSGLTVQTGASEVGTTTIFTFFAEVAIAGWSG